MKKLAIMSLLTLSLVMFNGGSVQAHSISSFTETVVPIIRTSDAVADKDLEMLYAGYCSLPENLRSRIDADDVEIYLIDMSNEILSYPGVTSVTGMYYGPTRYANSEGVFTRRDGSGTIDIQAGRKIDTAKVLLHETGHLIADLGGNAYPCMAQSRSAEMEALFGAYAPVVASYDKSASVNCYNADEMFAESFRIYIQDPEWLSASCPELSAYIAGCVNTYADGNF